MAVDIDLSSLFENATFDPVSYQYFHQLLDKRTVVFNDTVGEDIIEKVYLPLKDFEDDDSTEPVTLIINSEGGSVTEGFFIAYYIASYKKPLKIIVTGCAASIAAVILAGGTNNKNITRYCYPNSFGLIHDGYVALASSESKTASDIMAFNETVDEKIKEFILQNTTIPEELYDSKMRHQWFLTAEEMKEYKLIDEIIK